MSRRLSGAMAAPASSKEKRSFSKRLLFRGRAGSGSGLSSSGPSPAAEPRPLGGFMSRVLKTLSALSHLGPSASEASSGLSSSQHGLGRCFQPSPEPEPTPPCPPPEATLLPPAPPPPSSSSSSAWACTIVPGVSGLRNHGNTCFMNAVLQCLSNTELFAEYLALEHYRATQGGGEGGPEAAEAPVPEEERGPSSGGEVTEQLAHLVRALWTLEYTPQHSREFKVSSNSTWKRMNDPS